MNARPSDTARYTGVAKWWNRRWWDRPDGELTITGQQFIFRSTGFSAPWMTKELALSLTDIETVETSQVWGGVPAIRITVAREPMVFTFTSGASRDEALAALGAVRSP